MVNQLVCHAFVKNKGKLYFISECVPEDIKWYKMVLGRV